MKRRLHELLLPVLELCVERGDLLAEAGYVGVEGGYVVAYGVYALALVGNLGVDQHEVLQPLLHVALVAAQLPLLRLYLLLHLGALVAQARDCLGLLLRGLFLGGARRLGLLLGRGLARLCVAGRHGQGQREQQCV